MTKMCVVQCLVMAGCSLLLVSVNTGPCSCRSFVVLHSAGAQKVLGHFLFPRLFTRSSLFPVGGARETATAGQPYSRGLWQCQDSQK